jgi:hypothetical protein
MTAAVRPTGPARKDAGSENLRLYAGRARYESFLFLIDELARATSPQAT